MLENFTGGKWNPAEFAREIFFAFFLASDGFLAAKGRFLRSHCFLAAQAIHLLSNHRGFLRLVSLGLVVRLGLRLEGHLSEDSSFLRCEFNLDFRLEPSSHLEGLSGLATFSVNR